LDQTKIIKFAEASENYAPLVMVSLSDSKRKTGGPPVYQHGLFELSIDPS
jgi:hypothetical protein